MICLPMHCGVKIIIIYINRHRTARKECDASVLEGAYK